ncbi:hypothetical protein HHI36_023497, partial [Cryptolaemus montrouzieri]
MLVFGGLVLPLKLAIHVNPPYSYGPPKLPIKNNFAWNTASNRHCNRNDRHNIQAAVIGIKYGDCALLGNDPITDSRFTSSNASSICVE